MLQRGAQFVMQSVSTRIIYFRFNFPFFFPLSLSLSLSLSVSIFLLYFTYFSLSKMEAMNLISKLFCVQKIIYDYAKCITFDKRHLTNQQ